MGQISSRARRTRSAGYGEEDVEGGRCAAGWHTHADARARARHLARTSLTGGRAANSVVANELSLSERREQGGGESPLDRTTSPVRATSRYCGYRTSTRVVRARAAASAWNNKVTGARRRTNDNLCDCRRRLDLTFLA